MLRSFKKTISLFKSTNYLNPFFFSTQKWVYAEKSQLLNVEFINACQSLTSQERPPFVVLDVRDDEEVSYAKLPYQNDKGVEIPTLHIPLGLIMTNSTFLDKIPKDKYVLCLSREGRRASHAAFFLKSRGYKVLNIFGGIDGISDIWTDIPKY